MTAVDRAFSTSFCALDAFSLVEPAIASAPVSTSRQRSASGASGAVRLLLTSTVSAPAARAVRSAPATNGVRPLAVRPTATSPAPSRAAALAPSASSSSAFSAATATASEPPAWCATKTPGATPNVGPTSAASSTPIRPDEPAPK